jgi:DNA-binding HxlR family transcriptional regulator
MSSLSTQTDAGILDVRPGKWTLLVIDQLRAHTLRFSELRRSITGISQKTLTATLRELERDGFISRTVFPTIPPRVDYELTALGASLLVMVDQWQHFADQHQHAVAEARRQFDLAASEPAVRFVGGH